MERLTEYGRNLLFFGCYAVCKFVYRPFSSRRRTHFEPEVGQFFVEYFLAPITDFGINLREDRKIICACRDICA